MATSTLVTFVLYLALVLILVGIANLKTKNLSDYMLGGRSLGGAIAALGAGASDMSGWLLLALPGAIFLHGMAKFWIPLGLAIGAFINWWFVAKRLRIYTELAQDALTIPAYLYHRFADGFPILRIVTALTVLFFFTVYTGAGFVSGAVLFHQSLHIDYAYGLFITVAVIMGYTCVGGFLAVSWLDFFQGTLMFIALILVPVMTALHLGGFLPSLSLIKHQSPHILDAFNQFSYLGTLSVLAWGLGYFGQPHILVRFMAVSSVKVIPKARFICMTWMIIALYGAVFTGLLGRAYFINAHEMLKDPETVFLALSQTLFSPWIGGALLAAVLSAVMSTIAAQLLAASSALTEDFYHVFLRKSASQRELVFISRVTVVSVSVVAMVIALYSHSTILRIVSYAWSGLGASFGPTILLSLFWRRMTKSAAVVGIITGGITVIIWEMLGAYTQAPIFAVYSILPGFCLSFAAVVLATLCCRRGPCQETLALFDEFKQVLKSA